MKEYLKNEEFYVKIFKIILFIMPFIIGLFYEFTSYLAGMILSLYLIYIIFNKGKLKIFLNYQTVILVLIIMSYLGGIFYGIDKGTSFVGFLKFLPSIIFCIILMQFDEKKKDSFFEFIPISGMYMVCICIICKLIGILEDCFYMNERLGGFFQYSNTFALFLLMGIVVIGYKEKITKKDYINLAILILGILLTGSRSIFIFTIISILILMFSNKIIKKKILMIFLVLIVLSIGIVYFSKSSEGIGRFLTISLNSSTFLGRLLYYKDGINLILKKPFGLGYMGYFYMEPKIQTGVYVTRYIHNDFLQLALDCGIFMAIILLISMGITFFSKKTSKLQKHLTLIIFLGGMFDFNFQFLIIIFILVMTFDIYNGKEFVIDKKSIKVISSILCIIMLVFLYFTIAFFMTYINQDEIAVKMFNGNTESKTILLAEASSPEEADKIADELIEQNNMSYLAYDAKALVAAVNKDFEKVVYYKEKNLGIRKYWVSEYEDYVNLLKRAVEYYDKKDDVVNKKIYVKKIKEIPKMLASQKENTSKLAFKINDKPIFELSIETQKYINSLEE